MEELYRQSQEVLDGKEPVAKTLPCAGDKKHFPIAFNCIPQVDKFDLSNGYSKEEMKMVNETKKIFNKDIEVNATCVRVPVLRAHSQALNVTFTQEICPKKAYELLENAPGVKVYEKRSKNRFPMPIDAAEQDDVYCGRIRKDLSCANTLDLWVVGDQILKGAALNAVQIAEHLLK